MHIFAATIKLNIMAEDKFNETIEALLKEGKVKQVLEFILNSNKNLSLDEAKEAFKYTDSFRESICDLYKKDIEHEEKVLQMINETKKDILNCFRELKDSTGEQTIIILKMIGEMVTQVNEIEKKVIDNGQSSRNNKFFGLLLAAVAILGFIISALGNNKSKQ